MAQTGLAPARAIPWIPGRLLRSSRQLRPGTNPALNAVMITAPPRDTYSAEDRRTSPRIELLGEIDVRVMPLRLPVVLLDLSPGGFALASPVPFVRHAEYTFQFSGTRPLGSVRAKDVHCLRVSHGVTDASYVAGFSFVLEQPTDQAVVDDLISEARQLMLGGSPHAISH